eukprot:3404739-Amphidinium_carterae.1
MMSSGSRLMVVESSAAEHSMAWKTSANGRSVKFCSDGMVWLSDSLCAHTPQASFQVEGISPRQGCTLTCTWGTTTTRHGRQYWERGRILQHTCAAAAPVWVADEYMEATGTGLSAMEISKENRETLLSKVQKEEVMHRCKWQTTRCCRQQKPTTASEKHCEMWSIVSAGHPGGTNAVEDVELRKAYWRTLCGN